MQFHWKRSCRYNRNQRAVRAEYALDYFDFNVNKVVEYAKMRNPEIEIMFVSAKTGEGIKQAADWILKNTIEWKE